MRATAVPPLAMGLALAFFLAGCSAAPGDDADGPDFSGLGLQATDTTGVIRGIVVDEAIRPVAGAEVTLTPGERTTSSGADGTFGFDGLEPGTYFLRVQRTGFNATQTSTDVRAGVLEPPIVKVLLAANPATSPYVETLTFNGFLSFGAAIGITSVGTTINPDLSEALSDTSIWTVSYDVVPHWAQGELVWEHNQAAGGMLIWEMVVGGTNDFKGHRETTVSPALAYWNTTTLQAEADNVTDNGIAYRFFGGPHPAAGPGWPAPEDECPVIPTVVLGDRNPCRFGYGLTVQQRADAYVHQFYNFVPVEGWRFTVDGSPIVPQ